jgi:hypothetical protein
MHVTEPRLMTDVVLAPFLALFSPSFYRRIGEASLGRAFLYLCYLSFFFSLAIGALLVWRWMPAVDAIVVWSAERMPAVTFTRDGPVTDVGQPFELNHPAYGRLLVIDTHAEFPDPDRPAWLWLTGRQLVFAPVNSPRTSEFRSVDVVPASPERRQEWHDVILDRRHLERMYEDLMPWAPVVALLAFPVFFVCKLCVALAYGMLGAVVSFVLRKRLPYRRVLGLTIFAMTPVVMLEFAALAGLANPVASSLRVSAAVTVAYLCVAIASARRGGAATPARRPPDAGRQKSAPRKGAMPPRPAARRTATRV